jgi:aspartate aminotransferase
MSSSITTTSFPAEAVPQAPEDALFGLMRAYRADESKDKVDLVGHLFGLTALL